MHELTFHLIEVFLPMCISQLFKKITFVNIFLGQHLKLVSEGVIPWSVSPVLGQLYSNSSILNFALFMEYSFRDIVCYFFDSNSVLQQKSIGPTYRY